ncbi:hypothetical protein AQJ46_01175 [Streptomyces canus]|uniref:Orc1-like AAA ATPase domain-containing protein n=1 Tax=Streptomyces canus TaxID=58343 RepID=A0A124I0H5_9ACTN|nr:MULTISPECIES: ATP-binding protein [Streptomyces]KUN74216.1 hypothetical protein AQJ46_01175 [Streptomyces canus]MDI5911734.1 ATP-binding protein [Streptomyces sp. 12257]
MRVTNPLLVGVTSPLVGRDRDLEWVSGFLTHTDSGGALLLSGEPGVGKTALLDAVAKSAVDAGTRVLRAAGVH